MAGQVGVEAAKAEGVAAKAAEEGLAGEARAELGTEEPRKAAGTLVVAMAPLPGLKSIYLHTAPFRIHPCITKTASDGSV